MVSSQEMFMLLFSVLYGIMLNSLIGLGAFPITSALAGEDAFEAENDEVEVTVWKSGTKSRNRFFLSLGLLNLAPFVYFATSFHFVGFLLGELPSTLSLWFILQIVCIGFLSLGVFAFYYFFFGLAICGGSSFYTTYELRRIKEEEKKIIHKDSRSHILAGVLYLIPWLLVANIWGMFVLLRAIRSLLGFAVLL